MTTPTQRTLRLLRQKGCLCGIVERFNTFAGKYGQRFDLFGFIDIIALYPDKIVGIQSCGSSYSQHKQKILENDVAPEWIKFAGIELWAWRKVKKKRGGQQMIWQPRLYSFTEDDFS